MSQRGSIVKRGSTWTVYWFVSDMDGKRVQRSKGGFRRLSDAKRYLTAVLSAVQDGTYIEPTPLTVGQFISTKWLGHLDNMVANGKLRPSTAAFYRRAAVLTLVPRIGAVRLVALDAPTLNRLYADLLTDGRRDGSGGLSPTSVHAVAVTVGKMLGDAVRWGVLARNVADQADPPSVAHPDMESWTPAQLRTFLAHVSTDRLFGMWLLFITTGMRRGEVAGLSWNNLDLDAGELHVRTTRTVVDYQVHEGDPKTAKSRRTISLDPVTVAALRRWKLASPPEAVFVFTTELGQALHPERITKAFQAHAKAAGLPVIPLHGARHSYASAALEAGVDLKTVSSQLGHSSLAVTADLYQHVSDRLRQTSANRTASFILGEVTG